MIAIPFRRKMGWKELRTLVVGGAILLGLYLTSLYSYLLFHSLAEVASILVAFSIFVLAWNARGFLESNYLLFLGIAFFFIGGLDLVHTLAYKGMGVFPGYGANLPTQLWIVARYVHSLSLLLATLTFGKRLNLGAVIAAYTLVTALLLASVFYWQIFPDSYIEGVGLTPFKKFSEYLICGILLLSILSLVRNRRQFDLNVFKLLVLSALLTVASELAFTFYVGVYDLSNLVGHIFKLLAFYLLYKAIVENGLVKPYSLLFRELKQREVELRLAGEQLEQRVQERTQQIEKANQELLFEIKERQLVEAALRESQSMFTSLFENAPDGTVVIDHHGKIVRINRQAETMFGYQRDELLDQPVEVLLPVNFRRVHAKERRAYMAQPSTRRMAPGRHYYARYRDGSQFPVDVNLGSVETQNGILVLGLIRDITERVQAEKKIQRLNSELERRVIQRTAELTAAVNELEAFAYTVSHDLRAPLRSIQGYAQILLSEIDDQLSGEHQRYLTLITENSQQMMNLIDDLLNFSRLARQPIKRGSLEPAELVYQAWEDLVDENGDRQAEIVVGDMPVCQGDPVLLKQVFVNLLSNALKYTRKRSVAQIRVGSREENGETIYFVRDNGVGFDMRYADQIFAVFKRLHSADEFEGTGVGLAIVKRIVERHGGRVWAHAELDKGATFSFTLAQGGS